MAVLLQFQGGDQQRWRDLMTEALPGHDIRVWPDVGDPAEIEYAVVWMPPKGVLKTFPRLRAILSLAAGVDHILRDRELPPDPPIVRLATPELDHDMATYVAHWAIHCHRGFHRYRRNQAEHRWKRNTVPDPGQRQIGILGMGRLGLAAAVMLRDLGFAVAGWSRTQKQVEGIASHAGPDGLPAFLRGTDILVLLAPNTPATKHIVNADTLALLPRGACLINPGRGTLIDEPALLAALDSSHIDLAVLDVFPIEPLPHESPFWDHPSVIVTPHAAGPTHDRSAARHIAENIRRIEAGQPAFPLVDRDARY
jgi:glyoxylate/hydroxypyruvate reductase A